MINKVILIGNLGKDPEVRTTQGGSSVANLSVATTEKVKDKDGNWSDHTEWHRVVCFGRTAENAARFLKKGRQVYVEGRIRTNKWKDQQGNDRYTTEIIADNLRFLGSGEDRQSGGQDDGQGYGSSYGGSYGSQDGGRSGNGGGQSQGGGQGSGGNQSGNGFGGGDNDIPF